jgi:hypothetical protein
MLNLSRVIPDGMQAVHSSISQGNGLRVAGLCSGTGVMERELQRRGCKLELICELDPHCRKVRHDTVRKFIYAYYCASQVQW